MTMPGARVLAIAGSDSGGGAGIQADIKTITALGGYGASALTALTAQNTLDVYAVSPVPADFVALQIRVVLDDIGADAIKFGMLGNVETIDAVVESCAASLARIPSVLDPVMVAKSGACLLAGDAITALVQRLLPRISVLTPNIPEAETLLGTRIDSEAAMVLACRELAALSGRQDIAIVLKGGHMARSDGMVVDLLYAGGEMTRFVDPYIDSRSTHGTGCTLASAIAVGLAQNMTLIESVQRAREFVRQAIKTAWGLGSGAGPMNHTIGPTWPA